MSESEIIFQQSEIITRQQDLIDSLAGLLRDVLPLLAQYQTVEEEERRLTEMMRTTPWEGQI